MKDFKDTNNNIFFSQASEERKEYEQPHQVSFLKVLECNENFGVSQHNKLVLFCVFQNIIK